jgi:Flp pilus assembly protein TadD
MRKLSQPLRPIGKAGTIWATPNGALAIRNESDALRRAAELSPDAAPVRFNFATSLQNAGRIEEAEREFRKAAADFPEDPNPARELFVLLKTQYRDEEALEAIEEAVRRAPADVELGLGLASHRLTRQLHAAS